MKWLIYLFNKIKEFNSGIEAFFCHDLPLSISNPEERIKELEEEIKNLKRNSITHVCCPTCGYSITIGR